MKQEEMVSPAVEPSIDPEVCWKVLERVAASSHLNRAPRLREFLFYVGKKSLIEGINEVHEQEIGVVVFGRDAHYDTSQDNIVRVNATELRKRIDAYFISDGVNEPITFRIPRGGYKPVFRRQVSAAPAALPVEPPPPAESKLPELVVIPPPATPVNKLPLYGAIAAALLLAITCLFLWRDNHALRMEVHPWQSRPALATFWSNFLGSPADTDIVLADTSFALVQDITDKSFPLQEYLGNDYLATLRADTIGADRLADVTRIASRRNGSIGDFGVAERIKALDTSSTRLSLTFAREYTSELIKKNNTILIGSRKSNPWVDLFSDQMNFRIDYDPQTRQSTVRNLKPTAGEQAQYAAPLDASPSSGYSIIAYLPNPSHTTNSLLIEGTTSQSTEAAGEFITSDESLGNFLKKFQGGRFSYFEVLLKTTQLNGTPFKAEIITYRIH